MRTYQILFDPSSPAGRGEEYARSLEEAFPGDELVYRDYSLMATALDMVSFLSGGDCLVVCGGPEVISRFRAETEGLKFTNEVKVLCPEFEEEARRYCGARALPMERLAFFRAGGEIVPFVGAVKLGIAEAGREKELSRVVRYKPFDAFVGADGSGNNLGRIWRLKVKIENGAAHIECLYDMGRLRALRVLPAFEKGREEKYCDHLFTAEAKSVTVELDRPMRVSVGGKAYPEVQDFKITAG